MSNLELQSGKNESLKRTSQKINTEQPQEFYNIIFKTPKSKIMNTKIKLLIAAGMFFFTACNDSTTTTTTDTDSTKMSNTTSDTMDKNMHMDNVKSDNGLMSAMNTMMDKMTSRKMTGDFDMDFVHMMIEHHQGAIEMSKIEVAKGTDEKIKGIAQNIISMQTEEIGKLQEIMKSYKMSGMKHGEGKLEKSMNDMKTKMSSMQMTDNTDKDFANMMISHHEGAIKMANLQVANGMNNDLKQLAKKEISDQTKEINEFKAWLSANK